jgi:hypothetical protein
MESRAFYRTKQRFPPEPVGLDRQSYEVFDLPRDRVIQCNSSGAHGAGFSPRLATGLWRGPGYRGSTVQ